MGSGNKITDKPGSGEGSAEGIRLKTQGTFETECDGDKTTIIGGAGFETTKGEKRELMMGVSEEIRLGSFNAQVAGAVTEVLIGGKFGFTFPLAFDCLIGGKVEIHFGPALEWRKGKDYEVNSTSWCHKKVDVEEEIGQITRVVGNVSEQALTIQERIGRSKTEVTGDAQETIAQLRQRIMALEARIDLFDGQFGDYRAEVQRRFQAQAGQIQLQAMETIQLRADLETRINATSAIVLAVGGATMRLTAAVATINNNLAVAVD